MKVFRQIVCLLWIGLLPGPHSAFADSLDVFETGKLFPTNFLFEEEPVSLRNLGPEETESVLQMFLEAGKRVESRAQQNLVHLGTSYLYLLQKNYQKAYDLLKQEFRDPFILEDYRVYFSSVALRGLAENSLQAEEFDRAIEYLGEAFDAQMTLFKHFPASPFHEDVPGALAQIESQMGDVFFQKGDYPAAWNSYNRALVREHPNHETTRLPLYSALARTYEAGQNLDEAADIHIYLMKHFPSSSIRKAAQAFLDNNLDALKEINGDAEELENLLKGQPEESPSPTKTVARKLPKWPQTQNPVIEDLFHALSMEDFQKIVEQGEKVLREFPGDENSRGIFNHLDQVLLKKVSGNGWNEGMDRLVDLYPVYYMNRLASRLWESGLPREARRVYQKILDHYPTETLACHKALYFMGRIEEDDQHYPEAIAYYENLLTRYNWGYFTPSARFKIPWLYRLQGKWEQAREGFNQLLKVAHPAKFRNLDNGFQEPDDFRPAALYWLAQTERELENPESRVVYLKQLVDRFPMDFYAVMARIELSLEPLNFLEPRSIQKSVPRAWGLGELNRRRINRAEKLISIGFLEMGMKELVQIIQERSPDNPEFLYYLAQLFKKAGGYQRAISLSWGLSRSNGHQSLSPSLVGILFPKPYIENAKRESAEYRLSPYLVLALMRQESAFNKKVVSSAHAIGLMQLLPSTATRVARSLGSAPPDQEDLKNPEVNIQLGVKYLSGLLEDFEDNIIFALASYNAGPNKVRQWMEIRSHLKPLEFMESIPYKETRNYVKKVLRNYVIYKTLYGEGGIHDFQSVLTVRYP